MTMKLPATLRDAQLYSLANVNILITWKKLFLWLFQSVLFGFSLPYLCGILKRYSFYFGIFYSFGNVHTVQTCCLMSHLYGHVHKTALFFAASFRVWLHLQYQLGDGLSSTANSAHSSTTTEIVAIYKASRFSQSLSVSVKSLLPLHGHLASSPMPVTIQ